jgi:hypothetical protein
MLLSGLIAVAGLSWGLSECERCATRDQYDRHQICFHGHGGHFMRVLRIEGGIGANDKRRVGLAATGKRRLSRRTPISDIRKDLSARN